MTPAQIQLRLAHAGRTLVALDNLSALVAAANLASERLPVRWEFDPGTPATVIDYLAGGVRGAAHGAAAGAGAGLVLALFFPPAVLGYAIAGGALLGACGGVARVEQGWRVRLVYTDWAEPMLLVEAR